MVLRLDLYSEPGGGAVGEEQARAQQSPAEEDRQRQKNDSFAHGEISFSRRGFGDRTEKKATAGGPVYKPYVTISITAKNFCQVLYIL